MFGDQLGVKDKGESVVDSQVPALVTRDDPRSDQGQAYQSKHFCEEAYSFNLGWDEIESAGNSK